MMGKTNWGGVMPALMTEMNKGGSFELESTAQLVQSSLTAGVEGIKLVNQLTGMGSEWVRPPRLPLEGEERAMVERIVQMP